jgi:hypothetical protein
MASGRPVKKYSLSTAVAGVGRSRLDTLAKQPAFWIGIMREHVWDTAKKIESETKAWAKLAWG